MRRASSVAILLAIACSDTSSATAPVDAGSADAADAEAPEDVIGDAGSAPFEDVAASAGLPAGGGTCIVFDDFDGDARPDLFLASFIGAPQSIALYINDGGGRFHAKPVSVAFAAQGATPGWCAAGDVDADGKLDVVLGAFPGLELHVLRNTGGGSFSDAQTLNAAAPNAVALSAIAIADFDGDGALDVVAAPYAIAPPHDSASCVQTPEGFTCAMGANRCLAPPFWFRNDGAGRFGAARSITSATDCGAANTNALAITDWDGDGRADLFVANDWGTNRLYVNAAGAMFRDVWPALGAKSYNEAMGAAFEDFDFDGNLDLYVADIGSDQLYLGTGGGMIARHNVDWGVARPTRLHSGWAASGEDFDSDGFPDVFVASAAFVQTYGDLAKAGAGEALEARTQYDLLLHNDGGRGFSPQWVKQTKQAEPFASFGATAIADYDGDGRLDIAEAVGYPARFQLLHNVAPARHWLRVRLKGKAPNVDGIGAKVTISRAGAPAWKRLVTRSRGTLGGSWATLHFGLGDGASVDRVDVRWPNGATQTVPSPAIDAVLTIAEP